MGDEAQERFYRDLQRQSALWSTLSDDLASHADTLASIDDRYGEMMQALDVEPLADLVASTRAQSVSMRLVGQLNAAQAIAYREMLDAGGPDNADAYRAYAETTERHIALFPRSGDTDSD